MTDTMDTRPSVLGNLKGRRQAIVDAQVLTLRVPRWDDPEIWVSYRPLDYEEMRSPQRAVDALATRLGDDKGSEKAARAHGRKLAEAELAANQDVLINACLRVVGRIDGTDYSLDPSDPNGAPTRFDGRLAAALGLPEDATARQVVAAVFITEGDMFVQARELSDWSGFVRDGAERDVVGE